MGPNLITGQVDMGGLTDLEMTFGEHRSQLPASETKCNRAFQTGE